MSKAVRDHIDEYLKLADADPDAIALLRRLKNMLHEPGTVVVGVTRALPSDREMLDWLDAQSGRYTGKIIFRWSTTGRGWRLHEAALRETSDGVSFSTVREAIADAMKKAGK